MGSPRSSTTSAMTRRDRNECGTGRAESTGSTSYIAPPVKLRPDLRTITRATCSARPSYRPCPQRIAHWKSPSRWEQNFRAAFLSASARPRRPCSCACLRSLCPRLRPSAGYRFGAMRTTVRVCVVGGPAGCLKTALASVCSRFARSTSPRPRAASLTATVFVRPAAIVKVRLPEPAERERAPATHVCTAAQPRRRCSPGRHTHRPGEDRQPRSRSEVEDRDRPRRALRGSVAELTGAADAPALDPAAPGNRTAVKAPGRDRGDAVPSPGTSMGVA